MLKSDSHFDDININIKSSDKLTEPQQYVFVRNYFVKFL